jgi:hypothetical protein
VLRNDESSTKTLPGNQRQLKTRSGAQEWVLFVENDQMWLKTGDFSRKRAVTIKCGQWRSIPSVYGSKMDFAVAK